MQTIHVYENSRPIEAASWQQGSLTFRRARSADLTTIRTPSDYQIHHRNGQSALEAQDPPSIPRTEVSTRQTGQAADAHEYETNSEENSDAKSVLIRQTHTDSVGWNVSHNEHSSDSTDEPDASTYLRLCRSTSQESIYLWII